MINVLLDPLPEEWNGYAINTWFQVGIQIFCIYYDRNLMAWEKTDCIVRLLFEDEDGELREHPKGEELEACIEWFLGGWNHDRNVTEKNTRRYMDYDQDQWRIYADFRQIYGINLNEADLHWWEFCGMLWNMPYKYSSFLQVIDIRKKKITSKMSKEEKFAIREAKAIYEIEQDEPKKVYTEAEAAKIDEYDRMMKERKEKRRALQEAEAEFRKML